MLLATVPGPQVLAPKSNTSACPLVAPAVPTSTRSPKFPTLNVMLPSVSLAVEIPVPPTNLIDSPVLTVLIVESSAATFNAVKPSPSFTNANHCVSCAK